MLELRNLYKKYQRKAVWAVNNVSLQVKQGELLALIGESGSGKTTLLRLIAGFEVAESGFIYLNGREVFGPSLNLKPEKRRIGMVFQDYALFPHLTVAQNITFGLRGTEKQRQHQRLQELLALVGLQDQAQKFPYELSGGQQQRVALARALAPKPDMLLLDEPFSNLDEVLKEQMRREMRRIIKDSGITAVFVTHDTRDALTTADRIVILKEGQVHQSGTPQEIYEKPANAYVAGFFGQVNLLPAQRTANGYQTALGLLTPAGWQQGPATALLCIRPEQIEACNAAQAQFKGSIQELLYLGNSIRVQLALNAQQVTMELPVHLNAERGAVISCKIRQEALVILPMPAL